MKSFCRRPVGWTLIWSREDSAEWGIDTKRKKGDFQRKNPEKKRAESHAKQRRRERNPQRQLKRKERDENEEEERRKRQSCLDRECPTIFFFFFFSNERREAAGSLRRTTQFSLSIRREGEILENGLYVSQPREEGRSWCWERRRKDCMRACFFPPPSLSMGDGRSTSWCDDNRRWSPPPPVIGAAASLFLAFLFVLFPSSALHFPTQRGIRYRLFLSFLLSFLHHFLLLCKVRRYSEAFRGMRGGWAELFVNSQLAVSSLHSFLDVPTFLAETRLSRRFPRISIISLLLFRRKRRKRKREEISGERRFSQGEV